MDDTVATVTRSELQSQRQDDILRLTRQQGRCDVTALAEAFSVTTETIRRDLSDLQGRRLVRRVHGGAIPWEAARSEPMLEARSNQHADEKRLIALAAVAELPPEGTVILDSGSTTYHFARYFPRDRRLSVVTNSLLNARILSDHDELEVVVLGGRVRKNTFAMVDTQTVDTLATMTVDTVFVGCDGVSAERGFTTPYREEAAVKAAMIASARRVVALADRSKIDNDQFIRFADIGDVDTLITDSGASSKAVTRLRADGLNVVLA